ncbi:MAG: sulfotransferase domain-containing protein [Bacteroidota bacterium]
MLPSKDRKINFTDNLNQPRRMATLPDFLIIGAGKSGTTSLDFYLKQHPQVFMPELKEPNFFAYEAHSVSDFNDQETIKHYQQSITVFDEYKNLFIGAQAGQVLGEVSNTTMYMPHAIESIQKYLKNPKIIAILRNPAERLVSRFMHLERVNKVPKTTLEDVFNKESIWWKRADLVNEGMYYKHLSKFYSSFNNNNIHVILYQDLKQDVKKVLHEICEFLEIDTSYQFDTSVVYNKSGKVKNKAIQNLIGDNSKVINALKAAVPLVHSSLKRNKFLHSAVQKLRNKNLEKPNIDIAFKAKIINQIYDSDIKALEGLLNRDLSSWYQFNE